MANTIYLQQSQVEKEHYSNMNIICQNKFLTKLYVRSYVQYLRMSSSSKYGTLQQLVSVPKINIDNVRFLLKTAVQKYLHGCQADSQFQLASYTQLLQLQNGIQLALIVNLQRPVLYCSPSAEFSAGPTSTMSSIQCQGQADRWTDCRTDGSILTETIAYYPAFVG